MVRLLHYSDVENVYDDPVRVGRLAGSLARLDGDDALVVGSGDNTAPGVLPLVERGEQALDFFEAVGADYDTFGNHDFDFGPDRTRELVRRSPQTWISANVYAADGDRFGAAAGVVPWTVAAGGRVGLVGVTDPATDSLNPQAASLQFSDPVDAVAEAAATLRDDGVEHVVVLSHLGAGDDELAALDVDVVLGGHVHSRRLERVDGTLLARPGANGEAVVEVDLDRGRATCHETATAPIDEATATAFRGRFAATGLDEPVATADDSLPRTSDVVFGGECRVGNFVADAYRWATDADVGIANSGGVRSGPPLSGEVTVADLVSLVPFEEPLVVAELDGTELRSVFREASGSVVDFGEPEWWHAHVSGARIRWDADREELASVTVGGVPLDPSATYAVAVADYLLHSEQEFPTLSERHRTAEGDIQHETLAAYAREHGVDVEREGRVLIERAGRTEHPAPEGTVEGDGRSSD